jgi:photosystem II stability/assembly factor-like uncharacterized protein
VASGIGCSVASRPQDEWQGGPAPATRWRERVMRDERGRLAVDGRVRALRQRDAQLTRWHERSSRLLEEPVWTARGPLTRGGRARALVVHPDRPEVLWAAAGSGGIWKSEDAGGTWRPLTDSLGLPAGCLVMDPRDPDRLYFGTGERFHAGGPGAGIYLSRDGGESWKRLEATRRWQYVTAIAISPQSPDVLLAAVDDLERRQRSGVYRSTDAGSSWTRVLKGVRLTPVTVAYQPGNASRVLVSSQEGPRSGIESLVRYSDDGGLTWQRSSGLGTINLFSRYEIAFAPSAPQTVYAAATEGVYRSDDGGVSFVQVSSQGLGRVVWASILWVSPSDPQLLYSGGVGLRRSFDGGATWKPVEYWDIDRRDVGYPDYQAVVADPGYDGVGNRRIYLLNDGGIDRFDDARAEPLSSRDAVSLDRGMQTTEYYAAAGRARDGLLLGGTQDRGVLRGRSRSEKTVVEVAGDGACGVIDPERSRYLYGCGQYLYILRLTPSRVYLTYDLPDAHPQEEIRANFIAPLLLDPNDAGRMLAGGASLWRSENVRRATNEPGEHAVWKEIKPALPSLGPGDDRFFISAIAVAEGDPELVWVGHNDGRLFRTRNGLAKRPAWEAVDGNDAIDPLPARWITRVAIDRADPDRVFVALGGFRRDNLWRTDDGGDTWQRSVGRSRSKLPSAPVWSLVQHPDRSDTWVAGTEVGLYVSEDGGQTWSAVPSPIAAAAQDVGFLQGSTTLLVATFGRGLWTVELE